MNGSIILNGILGVMEPLLIAGSLFYLFFHMERTVFKRKGYYVAAYMMDVLVIVVGSYVMQNDLVSYIGHGLVACTAGYLLFRRDRMQVFYSLFYVLGSLFLMGVVVNGLFVWIQYQNFMTGMLMAANIAILLKMGIVLLFTKCCLLVVQGVHAETISKKMFLSLFIPIGISSLIYVSIMYMSQIYIQLHGFGLVQLNLIFLICVNLYFLYLLSYLLKNANAKSELELLQRQSDAQYRYYEELEEKYQESRKIIHDMRNHLLALEQLYQVQEQENGAAGQYASDLHQMLNKLGQSYYTDNRILNVILNDKHKQADKYGIEMEIQIGDVELSEIKDVDITTIFGNILDNAIEAARLATLEKKQSYIKVKADRFRDFTVISIHNTVTEQDYGEFKGHKGIGLRNVQKVLDAYGGGIKVERLKEEFHISITIPGKEEN